MKIPSDPINKALNPHEHSHSAVRHHDDGGGVRVPPLDEMPQTPVPQPGRSNYSTGTDYETPRGGHGQTSKIHK